MKYRIFEFEHVIYKGKIKLDFFWFCLKQNFKQIQYLYLYFYYYLLFRMEKITKEQYYEKYFSYLKGKNSIHMIQQFWETHQHKLNLSFLLNIDKKKDICISVLPLELIQPILEKYGLEQIYATEYNFQEAKLIGNIFIGSERDFLHKKKIETFYGFQQSDTELFNESENAYICKRTMKPYTKKRLEQKGLRIFKISCFLLFLVFWILSINFYFSMKITDIQAFKHYFEQPMIVILNALPIIILLIFFFLCTNRLWISFGITNFLVFIMGFVNRNKLIYRDDPLVAADLTLLSESLEMSKRYELKITFFTLFIVFVSFLLMFILYLWQKKKCPKKKRILLLPIVLISSILLFFTVYHNDTIYGKVGDQTGINIWSYTEQYRIRGMLYPFLYSSKTATIQKPKNYDKKESESILLEYQEQDMTNKVNIISIMLEAYQDFSIFDSVTLNEDIYKELHEIEKESYSGRIISNVFGGGTVNTEYSYLTGFYHMPTFRKKTNSFIQCFQKQGYATEAMHPIYGWFYNRRNINPLLGFDNFDYYENRFSEIQTEFLTDDQFFDYIIEGYEKSKKPYFHFSVTYQNHGPYTTEKLYEEEYLKKTENMDEPIYNMINNYLHGVADTTKALKKLIEYFKQQEEPVVILIFADHNPYLGEDNIGYQQMGIDTNLDTKEGFINNYGVPYFIWANEKAKEITNHDFIGEAPMISPMFLMSELFEQLNQKGNPYLQFLTELKKSIPVIHDPWYKENELQTTLSKNGKEILDSFYKVEYYWLKNYQK